uniref:Uncharacterized protein n=1 Tax=Anopheles quadriannulatus TaxID=34691 RepID=A0A182XA49_ANOQN
MKANCIHAKILTGKRRDDDVLLPRIYCDSNDKGHAFQIRRKQFPIQRFMDNLQALQAYVRKNVMRRTIKPLEHDGASLS